jgi:hypothetical protein
MANKGTPRPKGQVRQSQIVGTYGPGALVDLPDHAVIVSGLDFWNGQKRPVHESRLLSRLHSNERFARVQLWTPPIDTSETPQPGVGIDVWRFPQWFIVQMDESLDPAVRSRRLVHERGLDRNQWPAGGKKRIPVVPIRFVQACVKGHISDVDWYGYVHRGGRCHQRLWIDETGTSGDLGSIQIRCECGRKRPMLEAKRPVQGGEGPLGQCSGARPWLGPDASEACEEHNRLLVRSASDAYFSQELSVIHIPDQDSKLRDAVAKLYEQYLQPVQDLATLSLFRQLPAVKAELEGYDDERVYAEIQRRRLGTPSQSKTIKQAEIETLLSVPHELEQDVPQGDFFARSIGVPERLQPWIRKIVLVHRLREVRAQLGFTRFEAPTRDIDGELDLAVETADLAREVSWLPAVENRGEGVFLAFDKGALQAWAGRKQVRHRAEQLEEGFNVWKADHPKLEVEFPRALYIMLHSLSHLLVTAVSLECGYAASSIRERIYARDPDAAGILLYTGTPDAEGTLGGLVQAGRRIEQHLRTALDLGRLCSNDPVCAQHRPENRHIQRLLHGASCHGCLLIAETSCEQRNDYLDRALVVPTIERLGAELFEGFGPQKNMR